MQELRHASDQTVVVGVFLEKQDKGFPVNPYSGLQISWCYWAYLVKSNGTVVDIRGRGWNSVPGADGLYHLTLLASDVSECGPLTIYIHDSAFLGKPVKQDYMVVTRNVYDSKYGTELLKVTDAKHF